MAFSIFFDSATLTLSLIPGANANVDVTQAMYAVTGIVGAPFNISGFNAGYDATNNPTPQRRVLILTNNSTQTMTLKNMGSSNAQNKITTSSGADITVTNGQVATLIYDDTVLLWRVISVY